MWQYMSFILCLALVSCADSSTQRGGGDAGEVQSAVRHDQTPGNYQYCFVTADDTAILTLRITEGGVSGSLLLQYFGKERNDGKLENAYFRNDTLIADFRYWSDTGQGLREVLFLVNDGVAREAFGTTTMAGDKEVFTSHKSVAFNSPQMSVDGCGRKVPTFRKE